MKIYRNYLIPLMLLLPVCAQSQLNKGLHYSVETGATLSGGSQTPFWLTANKHGLSSLEKNNAYLSAGIFRNLESDKKFTYSFGLEMAGLHRFTSSYVVQQAYVDLRYRFWELSVGSKERGSELKNDALSTGGLTFSTNARPIPQVRISIPEYVPFPGTHQWLHIKGHVAYGRFTDDCFQENFAQNRSRYNKGTQFHSKAFFLKLEKDKLPFTVEFGLEMAAQFGGSLYLPNGQVISLKPMAFDYFRVLIPMKGGENSTQNDQDNIYGNHLGSYNFSIGYRFPQWKIRGYYEHLFADGSGMMMKYGFWRDCLAGLEVSMPKNPFIETAVCEFLYTKHQSGAFHTPSHGISERYTGADNYYNNGEFSGWANWGQGVGNPLLISPIYNKNGDLTFQDNRVQAFHVGFLGKPTPEIAYRMLMSYSQHWGTYHQPYPEIKNSKNAMVEVTYLPKQLAGWSFAIAGALDGGDMIGKSQGGMLTVRKIGWIGGNKK